MNEYSAFNMIRYEDWFMLPVSVLLFSLINRFKYKSVPDDVRKYVYPAFLLRVLGAVLYTLIVSLYYGFGDSHNYYQGVLDLHKAIDTDWGFWKEIYGKWKLEPSDPLYPFFYYDGTGTVHYYMQEVRTYNVSRLALPLSLFFNKSFLAISIAISYISFLGTWKIYQLFYEIYPHLKKKLAISILFLPSLLFWSTSLLKDPFCLAALGYLVYSLHDVVMRRRPTLSNILIIIISTFLLINLKPYILISLSSVFSVWVFFRYRTKIKEGLVRRLSTISFVMLALSLGFTFTSLLSGTDSAKQLSTENIAQAVNSTQQNFDNIKGEGSGSSFKIDKTESVGGLITNFPIGIMNTYFRPFFWDVRSPIALLSAFEAFLFLLVTLKCLKGIGFKQFINSVFNDPVITFCLAFAFLFGGVIGLTTSNFGALTRYKIPSLPFYAVGIILIMDKYPIFSKQYIFSRRFF